MDITYVKSESNVEPSAVDLVSSPTSVYLNKNIQKVTRQDMDGVSYDMYEFDRATLTREEYAIYLAEQAAAQDNIDLELAVAELAETMTQGQMDLELAIAELAETILG